MSSFWLVSYGICSRIEAVLLDDALAREVPGRDPVDADQLGDQHDAVDVRLPVRVDAVAAVGEHAETPLAAHATEAELAEAAVGHLTPGAPHVHRRLKRVAADRRRDLRRREGVEGHARGAGLALVDRRRGARSRRHETVRRRTEHQVVEKVDLHVHLHVVGERDGRLETQAHVREGERPGVGARRHRIGGAGAGAPAADRTVARRRTKVRKGRVGFRRGAAHAVVQAATQPEGIHELGTHAVVAVEGDGGLGRAPGALGRIARRRRTLLEARERVAGIGELLLLGDLLFLDLFVFGQLDVQGLDRGRAKAHLALVPLFLFLFFVFPLGRIPLRVRGLLGLFLLGRRLAQGAHRHGQKCENSRKKDATAHFPAPGPTGADSPRRPVVITASPLKKPLSCAGEPFPPTRRLGRPGRDWNELHGPRIRG